MSVHALVGTHKGLFLQSGDPDRVSWQVDGPLLEGWGGAQAFTARARRELFAAGESVGEQVRVGGERLTAQEARIAQLARDGLSNPQIAARLFISSRGQLNRALPTDRTTV